MQRKQGNTRAVEEGLAQTPHQSLAAAAALLTFGYSIEAKTHGSTGFTTSTNALIDEFESVSNPPISPQVAICTFCPVLSLSLSLALRVAAFMTLFMPRPRLK